MDEQKFILGTKDNSTITVNLSFKEIVDYLKDKEIDRLNNLSNILKGEDK